LSDSNGKVPIGNNFDFNEKQLIRRTFQPDSFGTDLSEFFYHSCYSNSYPWLIEVVGFYAHTFPDSFAAVPICFDFDINTPLLPGRDLLRAGRSRATSARFDFKDGQRSISPVV
jgi:hypothetical protein